MKVQDVTDDDNCPSSSTLMYKSRKNFARCNSPSYGNISSTSSEILKRPEPAFTSSKEKKITNSGHTVETRDSDIGRKYSSEDDNEDKLSEFDEKILNLAESDSESDTEYSTDEIETRPSNSGMKAGKRKALESSLGQHVLVCLPCPRENICTEISRQFKVISYSFF